MVDQEDIEKGLDLAVQAFEERFKQLKDDLRSIQNRAGIGLPLSVAALSGSAVRLRETLARIDGDTRILAVVVAVYGVTFLLISAALFINALRTRELPSTNNFDRVFDEYWKKGGREFQRQALVHGRDAVEIMRQILHGSGEQFNYAVFSGIFGILALALLEVLTPSAQ